MKKIDFKQDNIFELCIDKYDLCVYYGHHGMLFGLEYGELQRLYPPFKSVDNPFDVERIEYNGKCFAAVPADFMTDEEVQSDLTHWLKLSEMRKYKKIALTGVRNSEKNKLKSFSAMIENDDKRVDFIVNFLKSWLRESNDSSIEEILLISMGDNYVRKYNRAITID